MPSALSFEELTLDLNAPQQAQLQRGNILRTGQLGNYRVWSLVEATPEVVWSVLTDYEGFPQFLPSVAACRVRSRQHDRVIVERKDRRKIGWMPIKVRLVTENVERYPERIDYRMVEGSLDSMEGTWRLAHVTHERGARTLLVQHIMAQAKLGPLQSYFYEVFETGLVETMADLRTEMERRAG